MVNNQQYKESNIALSNIRKHVLLYGCNQLDVIHNEEIKKYKTNNPFYQSLFERRVNTESLITSKRRVEDTVRGKLWRLLIGLNTINSKNYQNQVNKHESRDYYIQIRGDTKRTFLVSEAFHSRVSESRIVRILNSFVQQYNKPYVQAMDNIAGLLLYVMPELPAFESFCLLINTHFPTYFYSDRTRKRDLIGSYASSYLAWDVLKICDNDLFQHLKQLPAHTFLFALSASIQTLSHPFTEIVKLWDFLFCFGFHLNPIMSAAHIIVNKKQILLETPARLLQGILSQRRWMNRSTNSKTIIHCTMKLIMILKESQHKKIWNNILYHCSNFDVAISVKMEHENYHRKILQESNKNNHSNTHSNDNNNDEQKEVDEFDSIGNRKGNENAFKSSASGSVDGNNNILMTTEDNNNVQSPSNDNKNSVLISSTNTKLSVNNEENNCTAHDAENKSKNDIDPNIDGIGDDNNEQQIPYSHITNINGDETADNKQILNTEDNIVNRKENENAFKSLASGSVDDNNNILITTEDNHNVQSTSDDSKNSVLISVNNEDNNCTADCIENESKNNHPNISNNGDDDDDDEQQIQYESDDNKPISNAEDNSNNISMSDSVSTQSTDSNDSSSDDEQESDDVSDSSSDGERESDDKNDASDSSSSGWSSTSNSFALSSNPRFRKLAEFELKDEEIKIFDLYEKHHNQLLSKYHSKFIESHNQFVAIDCIDHQMIQRWERYIEQKQD